MTYTHLDSLIEDDEDVLSAADATLYVDLRQTGSTYEATVAGYHDVFRLSSTGDVHLLRRMLQTIVDRLSNSRVASLLDFNHKKAKESAVKVIVRIPRVILLEVQRGQVSRETATGAQQQA